MNSAFIRAFKFFEHLLSYAAELSANWQHWTSSPLDCNLFHTSLSLLQRGTIDLNEYSCLIKRNIKGGEEIISGILNLLLRHR